MAAGYSKRSLLDKLGIKPGQKIAILNAPEGYGQLLGHVPEGVSQARQLDGPLDLIHYFTKSKLELQAEMPRLRSAMAQNGALWVSWPKGASKVATDLNENIVGQIGLAHDLVDVKVAAIDEVWSGLKFVIRLKHRR